jgi:hypothetical protein
MFKRGPKLPYFANKFDPFVYTFNSKRDWVKDSWAHTSWVLRCNILTVILTYIDVIWA